MKKRIIPCLDVRDGKVVKGKNFKGIVDVADPAVLAAKYNADGADELVFYDITASCEGRTLFADVLKKVVEQNSVPLTVGGGINTLEDIEQMFSLGADKVSINTGAILDHNFIKKAAEKYGSEKIILSIDVKLVNGEYKVFKSGGQVETELYAIDWAKKGEADGAGELVVNSIDTDGVKEGFDLAMLTAFSNAVNIPIIASGGAGKIEDFIKLFNTLNIEAGLAASVFHFGEVNIRELKEKLQITDN